MQTQQVSLPYINNAKALLLTLAINLGAVFLFNWPSGVSLDGVVWDSLFCAIITTIISMWIVYARLKKMRASGAMPLRVPESSLMQKLPQNPAALGLLYAIMFGVLALGVNWALLRFFNVRELSFWPWLVYKLVYATVLSVKIIEYCIFRYVQPDWAQTEQPGAELRKAPPPEAVKDPLPKISVFKEMFGSVTLNIAMSILIGSALGGVTVGADASVVIAPTTLAGIPITGLVFGLITGVMVTRGVVTAMNTSLLTSRPVVPETAPSDRRFAWLPKGRAALTAFICVCVMLFSAVALWSIMALFGISVMNFYQFIVFITGYASILSKPLSYLLVQRCSQPDYVRYMLKKAQGSA